jgi:hypothetical protein
MVPLVQKKPKTIIRTSAQQNRIVVRPRNPMSRYKLRSLAPPPGGIGHLRITLVSQ